MPVGDFRNYNHFIIFSFLLMNNISEMYYRNVRGIVSPCCQIRCTMWPLPYSTTFSNRIRHWSIELLIFFSVYPMHMELILKDLWCLHIALSSCRVSFSWCPKLHNQVHWVTGIRRPVLLSAIIRDIFIEIICNRICCVATSLIFLNSELFSTR